MTTFYTVTRAHLMSEAAKIRANALQSRDAWILSRESSRFWDAMEQADAIEKAAGFSSVADRREILRNHGFTVKTPRTTSSAR